MGMIFNRGRHVQLSKLIPGHRFKMHKQSPVFTLVKREAPTMEDLEKSGFAFLFSDWYTLKDSKKEEVRMIIDSTKIVWKLNRW